MLKFVCQAYDAGGNHTNGGCGEVDFAIIELKYALGKDGENKEISLSKDGSFIFTASQIAKISKDKATSIIESISGWSENGKFLHFAECPNDGCKHHVKIYHLGAKDGI